MTVNEFVEITREAFIILILTGGPAMAVALIVGLAVSLFQALTQIQENTLTFVPKVLALMFTLILVLPFMVNTLVDFTKRLMERIETVE